MSNDTKKKNQRNEKHPSITAVAYTDLMNSKKAYHITIASLAITVLFLVVMVSAKSTEIVVMPPDYYEPVIVNEQYANQSYAAGHAVGIALLIGNISSKNVDFVTETLIKKLSPTLQVSLTNALETEAKLIKRRRARQIFEVEDVMFRNSDNVVWVWGTKETTIKGSPITETFTYEFRIEPSHGSPKITHFDAYPGRPRNRSQQPVEVTPYLTRELSLVKAFAPGEIVIAQPEQTLNGSEALSGQQATTANPTDTSTEE